MALEPGFRTFSFRSEFKKSFAPFTLSLVSAPILIGIGFFLNSYLQEAKFEAIQVSTIVEVESSHIEQEVLRSLNNKKRLIADILSAPVYRLRPSPKVSSCKNWLKTGEIITNCETIIQESITGIMNYIDAANEDWVEYRDNLTNAKKNDVVPNPQANNPRDSQLIFEIRKLYRKGERKKSFDEIEKQLKKYHEDRSVIQNLKSAIENAIEQEGERTGNVYIRVGILNSGDSDGVVFPGATLTFGNSELTVSATDYAVIKSHSFQVVEFSLDSYQSTDSAKEKWRRLIMNKQQEEFNIVINSSAQQLTIGGRLPE